MKKVVGWILLSITLFTTDARAQEIKIGDVCPDLPLRNIINYPKQSAKISDFKGKLLILDFWATWCAPCVSSFPKSEALQKQFEGKLQIMPVAYEDTKTVSLFLRKLEHAKGFLPPSVTGDTILAQTFKHTALPHYVWIDSGGKVAAITGMDEVNAANVEAVLKNQSLSMAEKKDDLRIMDLMNEAAFKLGNPVIRGNETHIESVDEQDVLFHSVFTKGLPGLESFAHDDSCRFSGINMTIQNLFKSAFGNGNRGNYNRSYLFVADNRSVWEVSDSSLYFYTNAKGNSLKTLKQMNEWNDKIGFCYELTVPRFEDRNKKYMLMRQDLNRYFGDLMGIEGHLEKRKMKCLILVRTSQEDKLATRGGQQERDDNQYYFHLRNLPLWWLLVRLSTYYFQNSPLPLLDETNYNGNVDLDLSCNLSDVKSLSTELAKYGLKFEEAEREIDMIVISDKKDGSAMK